MPLNQPYPTRKYGVAELLLTLRSRAKLTQSQFAQQLGINRRSVQKWESGETYPTAENLRALITLFFTLGVFTPGREADEAITLWQQVSDDSPQNLPQFDSGWFNQLSTIHAGRGLDSPRPVPNDTPELPAARTPGQQEVQHRTRPLPFQLTPLIGRATALKEIAKLLHDPACHLLTLLGPGGIGKTCLGLAVAAQQTAAFTDGVAFVELAAVSHPNQIASAISDVLNLAFSAQAPSASDPTAHLLAYLRERRLLLSLDSFEHLLEGAALVSAIIEHAPRITLLITSQERLNLQAEWLFDVEGLAYSSVDLHEWTTAQSQTELAGYSAIQLFIQRASQVQPEFSAPEATLTTIGRICQQVAGMPLAILRSGGLSLAR